MPLVSWAWLDKRPKKVLALKLYLACEISLCVIPGLSSRSISMVRHRALPANDDYHPLAGGEDEFVDDVSSHVLHGVDVETPLLRKTPSHPNPGGQPVATKGVRARRLTKRLQHVASLSLEGSTIISWNDLKLKDKVRFFNLWYFPVIYF